MQAHARNIAVITLLLGLAAATWLIGRPFPTDEVVTTPAASQAGYYLKDAVLLGTDADGRIYYRVFAGRVEQSSGSDDLLLSRVRVEYEPELDVNWRFSAEEGRASTATDTIELARGVVLTHQAESDSPGTTIETQSLRLDAGKSMAQTEDHVTVRRGNTLFEAESLEADLNLDHLELQRVVATTHD